MTIPMDHNPEIVIGSDDPAPSAPPAASVWTSTATTGLPTAVATPTSLPTASTLPPSADIATTKTTATTTSSCRNIERTTNSDGSLSVKITTTTPQPNGYREVKMEYFHIPADMVTAASVSLDNGGPLSSLYMTEMEEQVLPPGTGVMMGRSPARVYPTQGYTATNEAAPLHDEPSSTSENESFNICGRICGLITIVYFGVRIIRGAM